MKKLFAVLSYLGGCLIFSPGHAADLKQSKFTQVVNDVEVISTADNSQKAATVNEIFNMPDLVRTGDASRAELVAEDNTITRVGANTVFSFDSANRTIDLQQGSLLFHSPKGKGGGTIRTSSATASVLGTTIIVTTTHNGGFKLIDLEGHAAIQFLNGVRQDLNPGQMTFVLPGGHPAPVITIRLDTLTKNSHLVQGFDQPLPSLPLIQQQVATQVKLMDSGQAQDTGLLVGDEATSTTVQTVQLDPNTISIPTQANNGPANAVTINSPALDPAFITHFSSAGTTITEFAATPNLIINTPTIDLSPYASQSSAFGFVASDTLTVKGSVAFNGLPANAASFLSLSAGNQLSIASGSTVEADVGSFFLNANGLSGMTLNGVNVLNMDPAGLIIIDAPSLTVTGGSIQAQNGIELIGGSVTLSNPVLINTGALGVIATGSITVNSGNINSNFQVDNVTLNAGDGIFVNGGNNNPVAGVPGSGVVSMTAVNLIQVQNLKLDNAVVNLAANTINLANIAFANGGVVTLTSHLGQLAGGPNTNRASVPGDVNFITNVTYGGQPAENFVPRAQGGNGVNTGITILTGP